MPTSSKSKSPASKSPKAIKVTKKTESEETVSAADSSSGERVQKIIAQAGITSRRDAEDLIRDGQVTINGKTAKLGDKATFGVDSIKVKGKLLHFNPNKVYYLFYKPKNVIAMIADDEEGRPTIKDLISKQVKERVFTVGRMDFTGEGAILLTNDGDLSQEILKSNDIIRRYQVKVDRHPTSEDLARLARGGRIEGRSMMPYHVRLADAYTRNSLIEISFEGMGALDVRKYFENKGFFPEKVARMAIGHISAEGLKPGHLKRLESSSVEALLIQPELTKKIIDKLVESKKNKTYIVENADAADEAPRARAKAADSDSEESEAAPRPSFDRPARGGSRGSMSDRPARGGRSSFGDRAPRGDRPSFGDRAPRGDRPSFGDRAPRGDRPSFGDRAPRGDRPSFGDRPARGGRSSFGDRAPRGDRPSFGDRAPRGDRPSFGDRAPRGDRPSFGDRAPRGDRPSFGDRAPRGDRPSFGDRAPRGDRPAFGDRAPRGDRPAFGDRAPRGDRPSFGDRPARGGRPSFGDRAPRGDRPSFGDRAPRGDRPSFGDRAPRGDRPSFGDRPPRGDRPSFGDRPARGGRASFGDRAARPSSRPPRGRPKAR
jgi:23S rRNA pseudouridine2605 synthase